MMQLKRSILPHDPPLGAPPPRKPIRAVALLPTAATLGNLLCGVFAVVCCLLALRSVYFTVPRAAPPPPFNAHVIEFLPSYIAVGCYLIVLAMIFDALDGRLARIARSTSEFGAQLDSIADIVSFGVAPVVLFLTLLLGLAVPADGPPVVGKLEWRLGLVCCIVYVCCAAIRLARYNAENVKDESATRKFSGIPSPGAAAGFIAILIFHEDLAHSGHVQAAEITRWCIAATALLLGLLMISRIPYKHLFNEYVRRENPTGHIVALLILVVALGVYWVQLLWIVAAALYVISGLILNWKYRPQMPGRDEAAAEMN